MNKKLNILSILNKIKSAISQSRTLVSTCILCTGNAKKYPLLCDFCLNDLPQFQYELINNDLLNWPAINKALPKHTFDHLYCLSPHIWPYNQWISLLKYNGRFDLTELLGALLHDSWRKNITFNNNVPLPTMVVSIPLHIKKWQLRGYNQAHLITKVFSRLSQITYADNALYRPIETESQVGKTGVERRKNMKNAFTLKPETKWPEHVIIIDDVITTGTTVNEISNLLKKKGVKLVTVLTVTIALPN